MNEPSAKELFPAVFSRTAAAYQRRLEGLMARGEARGRQAVIDWVEAIPGKRILDLGCGPGTLSYRLAQAVCPDGAVVGVDLAPGMIEQAMQVAPPALPLRFELMDMEDLRFPDASFDAAVSGHSLQFCPDLGQALVEARRVLVPGSKMAASVPVDPLRPGGPHAILDRAIGAELPPLPKPRDQARTREIVANAQAFADAAERAGFSRARVADVDELTTWAGADPFVELASSWWSVAVRLEPLSAAERTTVLFRAKQAIESELGPGPYRIAGSTRVLFAIA